MLSHDTPFSVDYRPRLPSDRRRGIGIIGCGQVAHEWHLPTYQQYGFNVVGAYDVRAEATIDVARFGVQRVYRTLDELLGDPRIEIVDIATMPDDRVALVHAALAAGKHVLSQKPFAPTLSDARQMVEEADRRNLLLAVNHNGRWAPAWRVATLLIEQGVIGEVFSVTHLHDCSFSRVQGTRFDRIPQFAIYDYSVHWFDITRCWFGENPVEAVRARSFRNPCQPAESRTPWSMWAEVAYCNGASAMVRGAGHAETAAPGHPFWIHGTRGTIRGTVLGDDFVELELGGVKHRHVLHGAWYPHGFAATMGELMCALEEDRQPYNSGRHNLLSLAMTLAAAESAELNGVPVPLSLL